ncbi:AAA family ATPase [Aliidiomarina quisquiliarum]|uniref:AAA family ATPase n=1 Tax=Aliidiomarina quisquiliarum TaxID=2938947 RepID=UPI00208F0C2D|nr:AAA family ATPase [Aliidiomarina quisquiliarum]MCO4322536.1 AAA family ATPase [Aliidiomarina quisquiliarum]
MSDAVTNTPQAPLAVPVQIMPSQQKLLEQLHYLTTFHTSMVILAGPEGAGKSTLLEVFLEQASDYANLAYLCATPRLTIENVRERLFQQISSDSRAQPNASLSKTIRRALPEEPQHLMLVVDDAHTLEPAIVAELQELVLHSRFTGGKHRISVIVSGTTDWAARQRKVSPSDTSEQPEIVLIPELEDSEALAFARALLFGHEKGKALAMDSFRIQATIGTNLLYPGIIQNQLQELVNPIPAARYKVTDDEVAISSPNKPTKPSSQKSSANIPKRNGMKLFSIMAVVALLIAAATAIWLNKDTLIPPSKTLGSEATFSDSEALGSEPEPLEPAQTLTSDRLGETNAEAAPKSVLEQGEGQVVMSYDDALPKLTEAARSFESDREIALNLIAKPTTTSGPEVNEPEVNEPTKTEPATSTATPNPNVNENPWLVSHDNAYFLAAPASQVVLQLGTVTSQAALNRFLNNVDYTNLKVYHTLKNNRSWYVVVTGNYTSLDEARAAVASLPSSVQALQPWAKPVSWIHNELAVVTEE